MTLVLNTNPSYRLEHNVMVRTVILGRRKEMGIPCNTCKYTVTPKPNFWEGQDDDWHPATRKGL